MTQRARNQREVLDGVPREQWDALHPGPLAHEIRATHVDTDLVRFEFTRVEARVLEAWVRLPTPAQRRMGCDRCPRRHSPKNTECAANKKTARKKTKMYQIHDLQTGVAMQGRWTVTTWEVPPGYQSGRAVLHRR